MPHKKSSPALSNTRITSRGVTKNPDIKPSLLLFENTAFYNKKNFTILSVILLFFMVWMSIGFGVNGDEKFQVDYSKKLWAYYSSGGKDTSALNIPEGNMHLYGGLFDITAVSINKMLGIENEFNPVYHTTRRVLCAVFGFLAILFTCLFARDLGGWPLAFLTLLLMSFTPRFFGDSMVNPKDIPFAAGYIMALYFIARYIRELPKPGIRNMIGVVIGIMIALNTRAGGLLLIAYLFLFVSVSLWRQSSSSNPYGQGELMRIAATTLGLGILSYFVGIVFWPYALANPISHPMKALTEFTQQPITISVLFSGYHRSSAALPWNYIPEWIIRTIPVFTIVGVFFLFRLIKPRLQDLPFLELFILFFSFLFPIVYAIYSDSTLHDGWRHFLFVYPSLLLLAALGWYLWFTSFGSTYFRLFSFLFLMALISENIYSMMSMHPYQYSYFNPLFGGIKKAYSNFETDYWMLSVKEASDWLQKHERLGKIKNRKYTVTTNCMYPAQVFLNDTNTIDLTYCRYYDRNPKNWDYAIFYSRFVNRSQLRNHTWPPKGTIHTVKAGGVPLCAIVKRENYDDFLGYEALKQGDQLKAIKYFQSYLAYDPTNETVSLELASIYKNNCLYEKSEEMIKLSLQAYPDNSEAKVLMKEVEYEKSKR